MTKSLSSSRWKNKNEEKKIDAEPKVGESVSECVCDWMRKNVQKESDWSHQKLLPLCDWHPPQISVMWGSDCI